MLDTAFDGRKQRGLAIAATARILRKGRTFTVPSQTTVGTYTVIQSREGFHCTCPDYELTGRTCKHGYAVEFFLTRETAPDGTVTETRTMRVTYSQPNWPAYNAAQVSEQETFCRLLRDLVSDVPEPAYTRGRRPIPMADRLFSAAFKVYSTFSGRRFMTDLRNAHAAGLVSRVPHYNSIFNVIEDPALTDVLKGLIVRSAAPLAAVETSFAIDSTGFGLGQFYRHFSAKYGQERSKMNWLKLHATVGTKTNVITSVMVTDKDTHDGALLRPMMEETARTFTVKEVSADKAYSIKKNLMFLENMNAVPYIPFKSNTDGASENPTWNRLFHYFNLYRETFLQHYHKRSNVESTFSALKRKFGDGIRSKTPVAQVNEALLKVLCHNLVVLIHEMHETGAPIAFAVQHGHV
jgi:transposase